MCFLKNIINDMKLYWLVKNDKYMSVVILYIDIVLFQNYMIFFLIG